MDSSIHQCFCSGTCGSQQPISPMGFLFLKLPPPPCAVLLVQAVVYVDDWWKAPRAECLARICTWGGFDQQCIPLLLKRCVCLMAASMWVVLQEDLTMPSNGLRLKCECKMISREIKQTFRMLSVSFSSCHIKCQHVICQHVICQNVFLCKKNLGPPSATLFHSSQAQSLALTSNAFPSCQKGACVRWQLQCEWSCKKA